MFRSLRFATWEDYLLDLGGNAKPTGLPSAVAVAPDTSIHFNRAPGAGVEVSLAHFTAPQVLTAASEIPRLAEKLQPVIVYEALRLYAKHDNAPEVYANAVEEHRYYMKLLDREQKPRTRMAESALTAVYGD